MPGLKLKLKMMEIRIGEMTGDGTVWSGIAITLFPAYRHW